MAKGKSKKSQQNDFSLDSINPDEKYIIRKEPELRIRGVSQKTIDILQNISKNVGAATLSEFMRGKISWIIETTPEHLKRTPPKH